MPPFETITSISNPRVKGLLRMGKGRGKDRKENFVFEGLKEIELAVAGGIGISQVFFCPGIISFSEVERIFSACPDLSIFSISPEIFSRVAYRDSTGGILVLAKSRYPKLEELSLSKNPLVLILESVEKPGNLGGILRTADASGLDAVIVCDPLTDLYNPNVIRNSLGCIFTVPTVACSSEEAQAWLRKQKIRCLATDLSAENYYQSFDYRNPVALVMGTEAKGLSGKWLDFADARIKIPMHGHIDSLNVSTAAAVLVFEAARQRGIR